MCNVNHVIGVDSSEWSQSITHDTEKRNKNTVNNMDDVILTGAERDPTNQEENPNETKGCDEEGVQSDEKAES